MCGVARQIDECLEGFGLCAVFDSGILDWGIALPLHYCREWRVGRSAGLRPRIEYDWLPCSLPLKAIVGKFRGAARNIFCERKICVVVKRSTACLGVGEMFDLCENRIGVDENADACFDGPVPPSIS